MKVLLVHARYALPGGEERIVDTQDTVLTSMGHTVVRYEETNGDLQSASAAARVRAAGAAVWSRPSKAAVAELIAAERPDVVHVHNNFPRVSPSVYAAAGHAKVPVVQHLHNARLVCIQPFLVRDGAPCEACVGRLPLPGVMHRCYRGSLAESVVAAGVQVTHRAIGTWRRTVAAFAAVSESLARTYRASGVLPPGKLVVCENGLDADPGPRDPATDAGYALYVGRLSAEKGVDLLVEAAQAVPSMRIVIAGDGPERSVLERRAAGRPNVEFAGHVDRRRVWELLRGARALVAPSRGQEPFGMTVAEAAASGVPAVVARAGALPELVRDGESGLVVPIGDATTLGAALARLAADPRWAADLGRGARAVFEERFAPEVFGRRLVAMYEDVVAHTP